MLSFNHENNIGECGIVNNFPHVLYKTVHCLVVDLVLFKLTDIKDADVIEPLAAIKTSKNEKLLSSYNTGSMTLSASRCFFTFNWVTPPHCVGIKYVQIV